MDIDMPDLQFIFILAWPRMCSVVHTTSLTELLSEPIFPVLVHFLVVRIILLPVSSIARRVI